MSLTARNNDDATLTHILAAAFFLVSIIFVWRSFYGMRIGSESLDAVGKMGADQEVARTDAA